MKKNNYINYIIRRALNLQPGQMVEIVGSSYLKEFVELLSLACLKFGASKIYVKYTDGYELENKIDIGYDKYIEEDIKHYKDLIENDFCRIVLHSPYLYPVVANKDKLNLYKASLAKLEFVNEYFINRINQKTICAVANPFWAQKLQISEDDLWEQIFSLLKGINSTLKFKNYLNSLHLEKLKFISPKNNLEVEIIKNSQFQAVYQKTIKGVRYMPNLPSLEVYIAPLKYGVNGQIFANKPLNYNGQIYSDYQVFFKEGKVIYQTIINEITKDDDALTYVGEVALCQTIKNNTFFSTLLDENLGCHLGLGFAYPYGITNTSLINHCSKHIDLIFGDKDILVKGINQGNEIILMENGLFKYE